MPNAMTPGASQDVAIGAASATATNAINNGVTHVRMVATSACYVAIAAAPTAVKADPGSFRLAPNWPETFKIAPGQKVAVIQDAAGGTLSITEMHS